MLRPVATSISALALLVLGASAVSAQEVLTPEQEADKRLGFYFALSLENTTQLGMANGVGVLVDPPTLSGLFDVAGPEVDGEFDDRFNFGFKLGFRLRNDKGRIEASFWQFDEAQNLLTLAPEGKRIANTLASPSAGFFEDIGRPGAGGAPDGQVRGFEAGALSEGAEPVDFNVNDGAEDWNFNGQPDFIRFATADRIVGSLETDLKQFDVDYLRPVKRLRRFRLDGRVGLRFARLTQTTDLAYRELGSFAVYADNEPDPGPNRPCGMNINATAQDGDGDGRDRTDTEPDGDGFMDGDCDNFVFDQIESVETVSEDRIVAKIDTQGLGLRFGLDGHYRLTKKWTLSGGLTMNVMMTDVEYRYREVFTSERDAYLNYIDWDFNGDGLYDNRDLDFDGSCANLPPELCDPDNGDSAVIAGMGGLPVRMRIGAENSVVSGALPPVGLITSNAFNPIFGNANLLRQGDPVPESERNRDVLREVTVLQDVAGSDDGLTPWVDLNVGAEFQFSRFARLDFGLRASRWFGAGRFRSLAGDVVGGGAVDVMDGDFSTDGYYIRLTVVPR